MDGVAFEFLGGLHDGFDVQVGIKRIGSVVGVGDVSHLNREGQTVLATVNDGRLDAHVAKGAKNTESDFAPIGNQHALEAHESLSADSTMSKAVARRGRTGMLLPAMAGR